MESRFALLLLLCAACCRKDPDTGMPDTSPGDTTDTTDSSPVETGQEPDLDRVPVAFVSDGSNEAFLYLRLDTAEVIYEIDLTETRPDLCTPDNTDVTCVAFGGQPFSDPGTGLDRAVVTYQMFDEVQGTDLKQASMVDMYRLEPDGPVLEWAVEALDFTTFFGDRPDICASTTPCVPPTDSWGTWRNCALHDVHTVDIVEETDAYVRMWVADTTNPSRAVLLNLDKGSTCAVVEDVLADQTVPQWRDYRSHNDVDAVVYEGEPMLLTNFRNSSGSLPFGGTGAGTHSLWRKGEAGWEAVWEHPTAFRTEPDFLNAPHNSDLVEVDGVSYVIYAHSNGNGAHYEEQGWQKDSDDFGSVGVLQLDEGGFIYRFDGILEGTPFNFLRDANRMDDGTWIVTDSGCGSDLETDCDRPASIRNVTLPLADAPAATASQDGAFSPTHEFQNLVSIEEVQVNWASPLQCGFHIPYEGEFLRGAQLGTTLRARLEDPVIDCATRQELYD